MKSLHWTWLAAFALGCGGGATAGELADASASSDASDAGPTAPPGSTRACGTDPHADAFCTAWADACWVCGRSATPCEREHFDEMCVADEAFRSDAWRAAVLQCVETCTDPAICVRVLSLDSAESDIVNRFCDRCPVGQAGGTFPDHAECVAALPLRVAVSGWSDAIWADVAARCLPSADAGASCETYFWTCANDVFKAAHANVVCNDDRSTWW